MQIVDEDLVRLWYLETLVLLQPAVLSELRARVWRRCSRRTPRRRIRVSQPKNGEAPDGRRWLCDHADHGALIALRSWARRWGLPRWGARPPAVARR